MTPVPRYDHTEHARAGGVEDGLGVGGLDGGGDVGNVVREEAAGDARPSPYRVLSVAPGRRVWRARRSVCERLHDRQLITHRKETLLVEPVNVLSSVWV